MTVSNWLPTSGCCAGRKLTAAPAMPTPSANFASLENSGCAPSLFPFTIMFNVWADRFILTDAEFPQVQKRKGAEIKDLRPRGPRLVSLGHCRFHYHCHCLCRY